MPAQWNRTCREEEEGEKGRGGGLICRADWQASPPSSSLHAPACTPPSPHSPSRTSMQRRRASQDAGAFPELLGGGGGFHLVASLGALRFTSIGGGSPPSRSSASSPPPPEEKEEEDFKGGS